MRRATSWLPSCFCCTCAIAVDLLMWSCSRSSLERPSSAPSNEHGAPDSTLAQRPGLLSAGRLLQRIHLARRLCSQRVRVPALSSRGPFSLTSQLCRQQRATSAGERNRRDIRDCGLHRLGSRLKVSRDRRRREEAVYLLAAPARAQELARAHQARQLPCRRPRGRGTCRRQVWRCVWVRPRPQKIIPGADRDGAATLSWSTSRSQLRRLQRRTRTDPRLPLVMYR